MQSNLLNANIDKTVFAFFISDLHLCQSRPHITDAFLTFLKEDAPQAEALYVLGDLFEYWAGDDDLDDPLHQVITQSFNALSTRGTALYLMHGNRDFLIGDTFCKASNMTLLTDPSIIKLDNQAFLLSHGDEICTDDVDYQKMRVQFRDPVWQKQFLNQPLAQRKKVIAQLRMQSEVEKNKKSANIMDVNDQALADLIRAHQYPKTFIHGHTHRPAKHNLTIDGRAITRWVLGDWYDQGSYLALTKDGLSASSLKD